MAANVEMIMLDSLAKADELILKVVTVSEDLRAIEDHLKEIAENTDRIASAIELIASVSNGSREDD